MSRAKFEFEMLANFFVMASNLQVFTVTCSLLCQFVVAKSLLLITNRFGDRNLTKEEYIFNKNNGAMRISRTSLVVLCSRQMKRVEKSNKVLKQPRWMRIQFMSIRLSLFCFQ